MTKLERAAEKARKEKEKLQEIERLARESRAAQRKTILQAEAAVREETRKATNKRRFHVGALADEAGLFAWSNADLRGLFVLLATLRDSPDPVAVLEGLLLKKGGAVAWDADDLERDHPIAPEVLPSEFCPGQREKSLSPS